MKTQQRQRPVTGDPNAQPRGCVCRARGRRPLQVWEHAFLFGLYTWAECIYQEDVEGGPAAFVPPKEKSQTLLKVSIYPLNTEALASRPPVSVLGLGFLAKSLPVGGVCLLADGDVTRGGEGRAPGGFRAQGARGSLSAPTSLLQGDCVPQPHALAPGRSLGPALASSWPSLNQPRPKGCREHMPPGGWAQTAFLGVGVLL